MRSLCLSPCSTLQVYARKFHALGVEGADLERLDDEMLRDDLAVHDANDRATILAAVAAGSWKNMK